MTWLPILPVFDPNRLLGTNSQALEGGLPESAALQQRCDCDFSKNKQQERDGQIAPRKRQKGLQGEHGKDGLWHLIQTGRGSA